MSGPMVSVAVLALLGAAVVARADASLAVVRLPLPEGRPSAVRGFRSPRRSGADLIGALDAVASSLRSGATVPGAVAEAGPGTALGPLAAAVARGVPLGPALEDWVATTPDPGAGLAAAVLTLAADLGGRAAEAVDGVLATLRSRAVVAAEARALAAQAAASVLVLVAAPAVFGALSVTIDERVARYFASPLGVLTLVAAAGLDAAGALWMRRLLRRVRP